MPLIRLSAGPIPAPCCPAAGDDDVAVADPPDRHRRHLASVTGQWLAVELAGGVSHTRTVLSLPPETMMSRSAIRPIATASTSLVWPVNGSP